MLRGILILGMAFVFGSAWASEIQAPVVPVTEIEKAQKRLYPGGRDEEDLKVLTALPEAPRRMDERSVQKEVYKSVFNQEMVDGSDEAPGGESAEQ